MYKSNFSNSGNNSQLRNQYSNMADSIDVPNNMGNNQYLKQDLGHQGDYKNGKPVRGPSFGRGSIQQDKSVENKNKKRSKSPLQSTFNNEETQDQYSSHNKKQGQGTVYNKSKAGVPQLPLQKFNDFNYETQFSNFEFKEHESKPQQQKIPQNNYDNSNGENKKIGLPLPNQFMVKNKSNPKYGSQQNSTLNNMTIQSQNNKYSKRLSTDSRNITNNRSSGHHGVGYPSGPYKSTTAAGGSSRSKMSNSYSQKVIQPVQSANANMPRTNSQQKIHLHSRGSSHSTEKASHHSSTNNMSQKPYLSHLYNNNNPQNYNSTPVHNYNSPNSNTTSINQGLSNVNNLNQHHNQFNAADLNLFSNFQKQSIMNKAQQPVYNPNQQNNLKSNVSYQESRPTNISANSNSYYYPPVYSTDPQKTTTSVKRQKSIRGDLDNSLTTLENLEKDYGQEDQEKAYSRKTPTRKVNIEDFRSIIKGGEISNFENRYHQPKEKSPTLSVNRSISRGSTLPTVTVHMNNDYSTGGNFRQNYSDAQDPANNVIQAADHIINIDSRNLSGKTTPLRMVTTYVPGTTTVVRIHGENNSNSTSPINSRNTRGSVMNNLPGLRYPDGSVFSMDNSNEASNRNTRFNEKLNPKKDVQESKELINVVKKPLNITPMVAPIQKPNQGYKTAGSDSNYGQGLVDSRLDTINEDRSSEDKFSNFNTANQSFNNLIYQDHQNQRKFDQKQLQNDLKTSHNVQIDINQQPHDNNFNTYNKYQNQAPGNFNNINNSNLAHVQSNKPLNKLHHDLNQSSLSNSDISSKKNGNYSSNNNMSSVSVSPINDNDEKFKIQFYQTQPTNQFDINHTPQKGLYPGELEMEHYSFNNTDTKQNEGSHINNNTGSQIDGLPRNQEELQNLIEFLRSKLVIEQNKCKDLQQENEQLKSDFSVLPLLQQTIANQDNKIANLSSENVKLTQANHTLMKQIEEMRNAHQESQNQNQQLSKKLQQLAQSNVDLKTGLDNSEKEKNQLKQDCKEVYAQNGQIKQINQDLELRIQNQINNLGSNQNVQHLNQQLQNLNDQYLKVNEELKILTKKRAKDKKRKEKYKKESIIEIAKRDELIEAFKGEIQQLKHQVRILKSELEGYNMSESKTDSMINDQDFQDTIRENDNASEDTKDQMKLSQNVVNELEYKNAFLKKELQRAKETSGQMQNREQPSRELERSQQAFEQLSYKVEDLLKENQRLNHMLMSVEMNGYNYQNQQGLQQSGESQYSNGYIAMNSDPQNRAQQMQHGNEGTYEQESSSPNGRYKAILPNDFSYMVSNGQQQFSQNVQRKQSYDHPLQQQLNFRSK